MKCQSIDPMPIKRLPLTRTAACVAYCAANRKIDQCGGDSYEHHGLDKNMSWLAFQRGFKQCLETTGRPIVQVSVHSALGSLTAFH